MKKKFNVFVDSELDYTIKVKDTDNGVKYVMKRSSNPVWIEPKEKVMKAFDDGESVTVNGKKYQYHELHELFIMLKVINDNDKSLSSKLKIEEVVNIKNSEKE